MTPEDSLKWLRPCLDECRHLISHHRSPTRWTKDSPGGAAETVTELDIEVERLLTDAIRRRDPYAAIISEESSADEGALSHPTCFVIDPIDGTDELVSGRPGFAISIALFRMGEPVAAVVDMPALDRRFECGFQRPTTLNGHIVELGTADDIHRVRLAVSATQYRHHRLQTFWRQIGALSVVPTPAFAAKFGAVLAGDCDAALYLAVNPLQTALWDYAAPAFLLSRAGGRFLSLDGTNLLNSRPWAYQGGWIASPPSLTASLLGVGRAAPPVTD